jgi:hypothetical protein
MLRESVWCLQKPSKGRGNRMTRWIALPARAILTATCIVGLLLFLVSAFLGGFRIDFGSTVLSCRTPERPLVLAIISGLLVAWMDRRKDLQVKEERQTLSLAGWWCVGAVSALTLFLLWSRSGYLSYYRLLVRLNDYIYPHLWLSTALYMAVGLGVLGLWVASRKAKQAVASMVALALFLFSPLGFYMSRSIVVAYGVAVVFWLSMNWLLDRRHGFPKTWILMVGLLPVVAATICAMHVYGSGWAFSRISDRCSERLVVMPMVGVLAIIGMAGGFARRGRVPGFKGASVLALVGGCTLAGSRGELGDVGAVALVPLFVILVGQGAELITGNRWVARNAILRNIALIAIIGMIIGTAKHNLETTICPPGYRYENSSTDLSKDVAEQKPASPRSTTALPLRL